MRINKIIELEFSYILAVLCEKGSFGAKRDFRSLFTRRAKRDTRKWPISRRCEKGRVKWDTTLSKAEDKNSVRIPPSFITHSLLQTKVRHYVTCMNF